jgi:hypothetical protein
MIPVAIACALLLVLTTVIHYEALGALTLSIPRLPMPPRAKVIVLVMGAFAAHALEIGLFAGAFHGLTNWLGPAAFGGDRVPAFGILLYFSTETYTSLGYGDIVAHGPLRLLAGAEALTGLLMIGWSTSQILVAMQRGFATSHSPSGRLASASAFTRKSASWCRRHARNGSLPLGESTARPQNPRVATRTAGAGRERGVDRLHR